VIRNRSTVFRNQSSSRHVDGTPLILHFKSLITLKSVIIAFGIYSLLFVNVSAHAAKNVLQNIRLEEGDRVTLTFLNQAKKPRISYYRSPNRVALDFKDVTGTQYGKVKARHKGRIKALRYAQFKPDVLRVVLDLSKKVSPGEARRWTGTLSDKLYLFNVQGSGAKEYRERSQLLQSPGSPIAMKRKKKKIPLLVKSDQSKAVASGDDREGDGREDDDREEEKYVRIPKTPVVVIDPGHGGNDYGAPSVLKDRHEKEITLALAKSIASELRKGGAYRVYLTRQIDAYIKLKQRVTFAQRVKADLFISVHADSISDSSVRGATVYVLSEKASDREAARLAEKENAADLLSGETIISDIPEVNTILIDLMQRETMNFAADFSRILSKSLSPYVRFTGKKHRSAGFVVLKAHDIPSVLLETGYVSNKEDSKFLLSSKGRQIFAKRIKGAVDIFFSKYKPMETISINRKSR